MLYIGIDISKYKHDCIVIDDVGVIIRNVFSFDNSRTGFDQFMEMYRSLDPTEIKK
nr:transposase [Bacilli bacterium]